MRLTDEIIEEVSRNLIKKGMPEDKAQRLVTTIREQFIDAFVTQHRSTIASMPINEKDRHVLAAAVASNAQVIVTRNLKDFVQLVRKELEL
jgi:predicted nucleic acid-binding protein